MLGKWYKCIRDVETGDPDAFDKLLYLNLGSPIRLTRVLAPAMAERGGDANIINISSVAGKVLGPFPVCLAAGMLVLHMKAAC